MEEVRRGGESGNVGTREIEICRPEPTAATLFYGGVCGGGVMFVVLTFKESIWPQQRLILAVQTKRPQRPQCTE